MENNSNNIQITDMDCWAVDDWAAFGVSLWRLQQNIRIDPAYISEAVDILDGIRHVLPRLPHIMQTYAADVAELISGLCCECIHNLADSCHLDANLVAQNMPSSLNSNIDPADDDGFLELPREWFDDLDDDDDVDD